MERVYFDNAATTPVRPEALRAMLPALQDVYGNASSVHAEGRAARALVEKARQQVADAIGAQKEEIYFTAGGTESDNWAIKGVARKKGKGHLITTNVEHHAVLHTMQTLEKEGFSVTYLPVDGVGLVTADQVRDALREDTILVSVMAANNEIGTLMPISEIGALCRERKVWFHTDAVQAIGHAPIDVKAMRIDLLSLSGHKLGGPKGIGCLYMRKGVAVPNLIEGGAQERSRRAGTENVPGIVGLGEAIEIAVREMPAENSRLTALRDRLIDGLLAAIADSRLNGSRTERLPGNANLSFEYVEGEGLLLLLDQMGIAASSGSACTSGTLDPSHVLLAIGLPHEIAHGSLRMTLGYQNTAEQVEYMIQTLPPIVEKLRQMSPLFADRGGCQRV